MVCMVAAVVAVGFGCLLGQQLEAQQPGPSAWEASFRASVTSIRIR